MTATGTEVEATSEDGSGGFFERLCTSKREVPEDLEKNPEHLERFTKLVDKLCEAWREEQAQPPEVNSAEADGFF